MREREMEGERWRERGMNEERRGATGKIMLCYML